MKNITLMIAIGIMLISCSKIQAHSGTVNWNGWSFNWAVSDAATKEGLIIRNLYYNQQEIMYKGSMPVIRVHYENNCGPFADRISKEDLAPINWSYCTGQETCSRVYTDGNGVQWLEIGMYATYGNYQLYYVWYFSSTGYCSPRVFSRGLQCGADHQHHVYFRLDFDIKDAGSDQVFVYDNNVGDTGWGNGWRKYFNEQNDLRNAETGRFWYVSDKLPQNGAYAVEVLPSTNDGTSDSFCTEDIGLRLYNYTEDDGWTFGPWSQLPFNDKQDIKDKDVVFWYIGHLHHEAADGADEWHNTGPWLYAKKN